MYQMFVLFWENFSLERKKLPGKKVSEQIEMNQYFNWIQSDNVYQKMKW